VVDVVLSGRHVSTFQRKILPPSSCYNETNCGRALLYRRWRKKKWVIQNRSVNMRILGIGNGDQQICTLIYAIIPVQKEEQSERWRKNSLSQAQDK